MKLLVYTSWFRPTLGRDCGEMLFLGLERRGHELMGVMGDYKDDAWAEICRKRGWNFIPTLPEFSWPSSRWNEALLHHPEARVKLEKWLEPIKLLQVQLGFSFFATWIPPALANLPAQGFVNFHPAPLPQYRGYFPEDLIQLRGLKSAGGTLHRVSSGIDEGPILLSTRAARFTSGDTPDSISQKISEAALPDLWKGMDLWEKGRLPEKPQDPGLAFDAGYEVLYSFSFADWKRDDHKTLARKFQVFRGQAHRMVLKGQWDDTLWTIWDWELHPGNFQGNPGDYLGLIPIKGRQGPGVPLVRTQGGVCVIWDYEVYGKEMDSAPFVDQKKMHPEQVLAPGVRPRCLPSARLNPWRRNSPKRV